MSELKHETVYNGRPVTVVMGWNNTPDGYFMYVEPKEEDNPDAGEETGLIYTNLDDPALKKSCGMSDGLDHYKKILRDMNIVVEPEFFGRVLAHCD